MPAVYVSPILSKSEVFVVFTFIILTVSSADKLLIFVKITMDMSDAKYNKVRKSMKAILILLPVKTLLMAQTGWYTVGYCGRFVPPNTAPFSRVG